MNFIFSDKEGRDDDFFCFLECIDFLTDEIIQKIFSLEKFYFLTTFALEKQLIDREKLFRFLKVTNDAQKSQGFKIIGINWDRSYLIFLSPIRFSKTILISKHF